MRAASSDDKSTLPEPSQTFVAAGAGPVLALTIVFHPDVARAGERVALGPIAPGTEARIGRNEPSFAQPSGGPERPLDDPHLSRSPLLIAAMAGGEVRLDATQTSTSVVVRGRQITSATFSADDVRRGVLLVIAGRVVLLLHRTTSAKRSLRGEELGLFGESDGLQAVLVEVHSVADLTKPVLLRGESGSGKELVARAIHQVGPRRAAPFVAVNLGAVPATIAATELFGSERGAFTGAVRRRGYFEQAEGGTLFLDEIGEAPVELQAALLRALSDNEIQPVGSERTRKVDVRVVAATDANLESKITDGSFRAPLLNRLSAYQIWIPPLRERKDGIARLLVRFFLEELREIGAPHRLEPKPGGALWLGPVLVAQLVEYHWPGNVRQLRNVVRHLVIGNRSNDRVTMSAAAARLLTDWSDGDTTLTTPSSSKPGEPASSAPPGSSPAGALASSSAAASGPAAAASGPAAAASGPAAATARAPDRASPASSGRVGARAPRKRKAGEIERDEILEALRAARWEIAGAAKELGIPRPSLHLAMQRLGIRTAGDLAVDEIVAAHRAHAGDLVEMAARLEVSERALLRRVRELGLAASGERG